MKELRRKTLGTTLLGVMIGLSGLAGANDKPSGPPPDPLSAISVEAIGGPVTPVVRNINLKNLPKAQLWKPGDPIKEIPRRVYPSEPPARNATGMSHDPLADRQKAAQIKANRAFTTPTINQDGQGFTGVNPPDTVGDIGPAYYIQSINGSGGALVTVYDKTDGSVAAGPFAMDSLATSGHACASGTGDPIVLYDQGAGRWFMQEFSSSGNYMCIYISQTADPVAGGWYFYGFQAPAFPDYPHFGVWPDAYYGTANQSRALYAFDRTNMLNGATARPMQRFQLSDLPGYGFETATPADWDGLQPPPSGAPGLVMRHIDEEAHSSFPNNPTTDLLEIYAFHVDFNTPANSSVTQLPDIVISDFNSWFTDYSTFFSVPQPGTSNRLDPIREVILNRLQYRNFGSYESLTGVFPTNIDPATSGSNVNAGLRWFELRKIGSGDWVLHQEGTYDPGVTTENRFVGSLAQDSSGNLALAYSYTNTDPANPAFPSLKYTGRLGPDAAGVMTQPETEIVAGTGAGSGRWGDYAAMAVDPVDDCTFWFTSEYQLANWQTRIASFRFDACGDPGFFLASDTTSAEVCTMVNPAQFVTDVNVLSINGFTDPVTLAFNPALPAGFTGNFATNPVTPTGVSTTTIGIDQTVAPGSHTLTVEGTAAGATTRQLNLDITVYNSQPLTSSLVAPADGATGVNTAGTLFDWTPSSGATGYNFQLATDAAFTNIVESAAVTTDSYLSAVTLSPNTTYYWRVTPTNVCGAGVASSTFSFTTANEICFIGNVPIPDNNPAGADSILSVTDAGTINSVSVRLVVAHTWPGDLTAKITHGGTTVNLATRMGGTSCSADDVDATFQDGGAAISCQATSPGITGILAPEQPLSAFNGMNISGDWTLNVSDNAGVDTGNITKWCILPDVTALPDLIFKNGFE
jgi:hypothetical protein